jgi:L-alanine-DL-glutamate epimerase-like enolase superfamily enzyme
VPASIAARGVGAAVERVTASAYTIPTDFPESDGTLEWDSTTIVVVEVQADGETGLGYTYGDAAAAVLASETLAPALEAHDALAIGGAWAALVERVRNLGRPGIAATAISALDVALWDLKARLLDLPLAALLDGVRDEVPVYGSGGFTSYPVERLQSQLAGWVEEGIARVKMKIGREPENDIARVRAVREAIGEDAELFVDANGAYSRKQALAFAEAFAEFGVTWFEEPVSSDDLEGLRLLRDRAPAGLEIAAGEYGYDSTYFGRMLAAGAVDCLQADASRCLGITGFLRAAALADAHQLDLSAHTAPALHLAACRAVPRFRHLEYFHDHVRVERMLFDGVVQPEGGVLRPDRSRPGLGLELRRADAERYAVR